MKMVRWMAPVLLAAVIYGSSPGEAIADGEVAATFQASYDAEAAGDVKSALAAMDRLPAGRRDGYVATLRRAWLLHLAGREGESVDAYAAAIALAPGSVEARVGELLPQMALRRWADAKQTAEGALMRDPGNYLANLRLAFIDYNLGRYPESLSQYRKLADMYPSDVEVRTGLGWALLKTGHAAEAAAQFREVLDVAPKHALAREGLAAAGVTG